MIANCLMRIIERDFSHRKMENSRTIGINPVHYQPLPILVDYFRQANTFLVRYIYIYLLIYLNTIDISNVYIV